jgi:hypothetical protein
MRLVAVGPLSQQLVHLRYGTESTQFCIVYVSIPDRQIVWQRIVEYNRVLPHDRDLRTPFVDIHLVDRPTIRSHLPLLDNVAEATGAYTHHESNPDWETVGTLELNDNKPSSISRH